MAVSLTAELRVSKNLIWTSYVTKNNTVVIFTTCCTAFPNGTVEQ